jgi:hypothetical protein
MNGRQRIAAAMHMQQPDRVPVMCQLALGHYFLKFDLPPHQIWFTSEGFTEALISLRDRYQFDGVLINIPGRPVDCLDHVQSVESTPDGEKLVWENGDTILLPWSDNPYYLSTGQGRAFHADFETIDPERLHFLDSLSGYNWGVFHIPHIPGKPNAGPLLDIPDYFTRTIDLVKERSGGEFSIHGETYSPFTHFMELFGYDAALLGLLTDRDKAHALLQTFAAVSTAWALKQVEHGVDAVLISSAFAGGPFLSRRMYREFVLPYERQVVQAVRAAGCIVYTHTCGRIGDRLDLMEETETQGIDTLDPPPLGDSDLADAKAKIGDRLFIKGNMNAVELLAFQSPEEVRAHAAGRISVGKPGGGYILSTACSVAPGMQPWKLEMLAPLAEELGRY